MTHASVTIQITPEPSPLTPSWMGEVAAFAQVLTHTVMLKEIQELVRFARARMGTYELIDFVVVLIGYILSGDPTLLAFYEQLAPWAEPLMTLFGRHRLPHRCTLSRFLAALDQGTVEALRTRFHEEVLTRKPFPSSGGLVERWSVANRSVWKVSLHSLHHAALAPLRRFSPVQSARNARPSDAPRLVVTLHGLPATFASTFGFNMLATA